MKLEFGDDNMTEQERKKYNEIIKNYKKHHPFKYKKFKSYLTIIMMLLDELKNCEQKIGYDNYDIDIHYNESDAIKVMDAVGRVVNVTKLWIMSEFFPSAHRCNVDENLKDFVECGYEYTQQMLNSNIVDLNKIILDYFIEVKNKMIEEKRMECQEEYDQYEEIVCEEMEEEDVSAKESKIQEVVRTRNELISKRIIALNALNNFRQCVLFDYIEILAGFDPTVYNKNIDKLSSKAMQDPEVKFIDPTSFLLKR